MILQLILVPTELIGSDYVFLAVRLDVLQNRVKFAYDRLSFLVHLVIHPFIYGFENHIGLFGKQFFQPRVGDGA